MAALGLRDLKFRYRSDQDWVIDIGTLDLMPGEQVLLRGGSGSGKSTLLHVIAGLVEPVSGHVFVGGRNMHSLHGAKRDLYRGRQIGMIFQTFHLLHGFSALENVMTALMFSDQPAREHRDIAADALKQLGIDRPNASVDDLSVGQQQRVAVARAIVCKPVLVLADEPTASLDPENALTAMEAIQDVCRTLNAALLCVSHDPALSARFANEIALHDLAGTNVETGGVR